MLKCNGCKYFCNITTVCKRFKEDKQAYMSAIKAWEMQCRGMLMLKLEGLKTPVDIIGPKYQHPKNAIPHDY